MPAAPIEIHPAGALTGPVDSDLAEARWCAYSWPVAVGNSGLQTFFIDQEGEIWKTANTDRRYTGIGSATEDRSPAWDAARPATVLGPGWASPPADVTEYRGRDGNVWKRTN